MKVTVDKCCPKDCVYRRKLSTYGTDCCMYAAIEHESRGCSIENCNRYKKGKLKKPRLNVAVELFWEWEDGREET